MLRRFVVNAGCAVAASFLLVGTAVAQTGVLSGAVFAGESRTGLEGATVTIAGTALSAVTGKDGRFTIASVPAGDQTLRIRRLEFAAREDRVRIAAGDTTHAYYGLITPREAEAERRLGIRTSEGALVVVNGLIANQTQPLIIVDGVIMSDPPSVKDIDPKLIESVEVLKGDAAEASYGSRATNGVVIITTKPRPPER
jgi:TonB-dependent SusC/RagA subfamily outer membrane receptor